MHLANHWHLPNHEFQTFRTIDQYSNPLTCASSLPCIQGKKLDAFKSTESNWLLALWKGVFLACMQFWPHFFHFYLIVARDSGTHWVGVGRIRCEWMELKWRKYVSYWAMTIGQRGAVWFADCGCDWTKSGHDHARHHRLATLSRKRTCNYNPSGVAAAPIQNQQQHSQKTWS